MTFEIDRASNAGITPRPKPHEKAFFDKEGGYWAIEINTLEELVEIDKYFIIDNGVKILIYDDCLE